MVVKQTLSKIGRFFSFSNGSCANASDLRNLVFYKHLVLTPLIENGSKGLSFKAFISVEKIIKLCNFPQIAHFDTLKSECGGKNNNHKFLKIDGANIYLPSPKKFVPLFDMIYLVHTITLPDSHFVAGYTVTFCS